MKTKITIKDNLGVIIGEFVTNEKIVLLGKIELQNGDVVTIEDVEE